MTKYRVVAYLRIEPDEDVLYDTREEAEADVEQCQLMLPQDIHMIEEVQGQSDALTQEEIDQRVGAARATRGIWADLPPEEGA